MPLRTRAAGVSRALGTKGRPLPTAEDLAAGSIDAAPTVGSAPLREPLRWFCARDARSADSRDG
jgi:hypothetical protein